MTRESRVWKFFAKKDGYLATCSGCHRDYSYRSSVSNLSKHWRKKHAKPNDLTDLSSDSSDGEQEKSDTNKKPKETWNFYEVTDSDKFEATCKICEKKVPYESVSQLRTHIEGHGEEPKDSDDEYFPEVQETKHFIKFGNESRRYSKLWRYFKIVNDKMAMCLFCHGLFNYASSISNLRRHLKNKHADVDLSQDDDDKKVIVSANGQLYEVETGPDQEEKDDDDTQPMEMDTIYLEDLDDLETSSPKKKLPKVSFIRESSKMNYSKEQLKKEFPKELFKKGFPKEQLKRNRDTRDTCSEYSEIPKVKLRSRTPSYTPDTRGSIDYFGQYIVSLLKELPKAVSDRLQSDIVNQILASKMALQTQTVAAKSEMTVSRKNETAVSVPEPVSFTVVSNDSIDTVQSVVQE